MIYSLTDFILERRRNPSKKSYLRFIFLFPIFYVLFFMFYFLFYDFVDIVDHIIKKKFNYNSIDLPTIYNFMITFIIIPTIYVILYIKIMKKYLSFNDINLFFILKVILSSIICIILTQLNKKADPYFFILYLFFFIPLCWILFFINMVIQHKNSEKRKKQSNANPSERDGKEEKQ